MISKLLYFFLLLILLIFGWFWAIDAFIENEDVYLSAPEGMKWIDVGKNKISYQHFPAESKRDLILIGGTIAWSGVWKNTVEDLKGEYDIYAIDLPPFGYSIVEDNYKYDLSNQADTINGFIKSLDLKDVVFIAHSYGAGPSMEAVFREQKNFSKFIIIDGAIHIDRENGKFKAIGKRFFSINSLRYLITSGALHLPGFMEASLKYLVYDNSTVTDFWVGIYNQPLKREDQSKRIAKWFYDFVFENGSGLSSNSENYQNLGVSTSIIWGREDNLTPLDQGQNLAKIIPNNNLVILDGVGHIPMIDNHQKFIQVLEENLSGR